MSYEAGTLIGDYEIVGVLGTGGMGKVYKVRNTISDRIEAIRHALQARAVSGFVRLEPPPVVFDLEHQIPVNLGKPDDRGGCLRVLRDVLKGLERAEVHGCFDLLRVSVDPVGLHCRGRRSLAGLGLERDDESLVREQRGVDPAGKIAQVVERSLEGVLELMRHPLDPV